MFAVDVGGTAAAIQQGGMEQHSTSLLRCFCFLASGKLTYTDHLFILCTCVYVSVVLQQ
jgi:hypothetical protein